MRIMHKDVFGFSEHQGKATYGLENPLRITRSSDFSVLTKAGATTVGRVNINSIEEYVPRYTPSISHQAILYKQILSNLPTEPHYVKRSVF